MRSDEPTGLARQAVLPTTLTLTSLGGRLEISRRWSPLLLTLLPALCCCFGPCGVFGEGLVSGTVRQMDNDRFGGYLKIPWLGYLMMAVAVLGSAVLGDLPVFFSMLASCVAIALSMSAIQTLQSRRLCLVRTINQALQGDCRKTTGTTNPGA